MPICTLDTLSFEFESNYALEGYSRGKIGKIAGFWCWTGTLKDTKNVYNVWSTTVVQPCSGGLYVYLPSQIY